MFILILATLVYIFGYFCGHKESKNNLLRAACKGILTSEELRELEEISYLNRLYYGDSKNAS